MDAASEQALISRIRTLTPRQIAQVEEFVDFLAAKAKRRAALDRLLAVAPALEAAGVEPLTDEQVAAEIEAARSTRRKGESGCPD